VNNYFVEPMDLIIVAWQRMESMIFSEFTFFTNSTSYAVEIDEIDDKNFTVRLGSEFTMQVKVDDPNSAESKSHLFMKYNSKQYGQPVTFDIFYKKFANMQDLIFAVSEQIILFFMHRLCLSFAVNSNKKLELVNVEYLSYVESATIVAYILKCLFYDAKCGESRLSICNLLERCESKADIDGDFKKLIMRISYDNYS
jgi:hypothetical protein